MSDNDTVMIAYKRCQNFLCYSASARCTSACSSAHAHVGAVPRCNNIYVIVVDSLLIFIIFASLRGQSNSDCPVRVQYKL